MDLAKFEIFEIYDTRKRDECRKPIPGTGDQIPCDCCGRTIEVHAVVTERKGTGRATVGTQCCKLAGIKNGSYAADNKNYWKIAR